MKKFSLHKQNQVQSPTNKDQTAGFVLLATLLGAIICGYFVFQANFPLNDGGMFFSMVRDLEANHFILPAFTSYNEAAIPFAYPPLAFYCVGFLHVFLKIDLIQLFRFFPLVFAVLAIPAFYLLSTQLLEKKTQQILAIFLYAVFPPAYTWQIMGGGVTRAPAWFFALLGLFFFMRYLHGKKRLDLVWIAVFTALTALTHLEMAWFLALTYLTMYLFFCPSLRSLGELALTGLGALLLASPWWGTVLASHGIQTFRAALGSGGFTLTSPLAFILSMGGADKMSLSFIAFLAVIGIFIESRRRNWFLFLWLLVLIFLDPRSSQRVAAMPMVMLAAVALASFFAWLGNRGQVKDELSTPENLLLQRPVSIVFLVLLIYALFLNIYSLYSGQSYLESLNQENRQAMAWVKTNIPAESRFVVLDFPYGWFSDMTAEWFPALSGRKSVLTAQGLEWLPGQASAAAQNLAEVSNCKMNGLDCFEKWAKDKHLGLAYVYFSTNSQGYYAPAKYTSTLESEMSISGSYELVFSNEDVRIYKIRELIQ